MYCPQCSQQQATGEMRFCSRCGFPLKIVSQLVANGAPWQDLMRKGDRGFRGIKRAFEREPL